MGNPPLLTITICWQAVPKNCNNSLTGENSAVSYGMEICCDKGKIIVNSIKPRPSINVWTNGKTLEELDQLKYLGSTQTKDGASIKKRVKDHTGVRTVGREGKRYYGGKHSHSFHANIKLYESLDLVNIALWF